MEIRQGRHQVSATLINTNSTPTKHPAPKIRHDHREGPASRVSPPADILRVTTLFPKRAQGDRTSPGEVLSELCTLGRRRDGARRVPWQRVRGGTPPGSPGTAAPAALPPRARHSRSPPR